MTLATARKPIIAAVAGYCLGLDMTVRGREDRSFRKSVDTYAVLGPWMVTADEIAKINAALLEMEKKSTATTTAGGAPSAPTS